MVTSTRALAKIVKVDISAASKHPGFVDYINKRDVTGSNFYGVNLEDQVFADEKVTFLPLLFQKFLITTSRW